MPFELIASAPGRTALRSYVETAPAEGEALVRTEFSACKHGTEAHLFHGHAPGGDRRYDPEQRLFVPRDQPSPGFPIRLGNMFVGRVEAVGPGVSSLSVGQRVYGWSGSRDSHTLPVARFHPMPDGLTPEQAVCLDPAEFALDAVRAAGVRLGDRAAVFGLGAIGLLAVQMLSLCGASLVAAIDPVPTRRDLSLRLGAHVALDPRRHDVGLELRSLTQGNGLDVALEYSGAPAALQAAIRSVGYAGTVAVGAWCGPSSPVLQLGEEFHMNRTRIISTRACSIPVEEEPRWSYVRLRETARDLFIAGKLDAESLVTPIVPFDQAAEAYARIDSEPERFLKLGFRHGS